MMKSLLAVVLAMCSAGIAAEGGAPEPTSRPTKSSELVVKRLTLPVVQLLNDADTIEAFRVGKVDHTDTGTADHVALRRVLGDGKALSRNYRDRAVAAVLLDNTYSKADSKGTSVGVGYRIKTKDGGRVEISFCLEKGNVQLVAIDPGGKVIRSGDLGGFRDDPAHPLRALAAEAFPDDADVRKATDRAAAAASKAAKSAAPPAQADDRAQPPTPQPTRSVDAAPATRPHANDPAWPPGWLPVNRLDDKVEWSEFRKIEDKVHLYLPPGVDRVRGVFVCYVFHSADPRELADLWQFAMVTVPWPFEYDLGFNDKRNGRFKLGLPAGDMGRMLDYLKTAATETKHPELAVAPIVGWLGQNGGNLCADLLRRAPNRVIAWADGWPNALDKRPELTAAVPYAYAWEFTKKDERERAEARDAKLPTVEGKPTPPPDFRCRANTYGFPHGIYSKFNFFAAHLDRCIRLRLPAELPPPSEPVVLRPVDVKAGWAGDYNAVGQWNPIAPYAEAKGMVEPVWMPDAYMAWAWRSFHSANPDLRITSPAREYKKGGGPEYGLGYGGKLNAGAPLTFAAESSRTYAKVEFRDGDKVLGEATAQPWRVEGVRLDRGLHVLFAVGAGADGTQTASRPAFVVVQ